MIRILQCVNDMHRAGLETMLMNYYRNIDRNEIQFDFLTHRPNRSDYDDEIESLGGKVYYAPRLYPQNYLSYFKYMKEFYATHTEYKIVHSHIDSMSYLPLLAAKKANIPIRIAHSHNTQNANSILGKIYKRYLQNKINKNANRYFACGQDAAKWLFRKKANNAVIIPNGIDLNKFKFDEKARNNIRNELKIEEQAVCIRTCW